MRGSKTFQTQSAAEDELFGDADRVAVGDPSRRHRDAPA
jgi:hypothetical protein